MNELREKLRVEEEDYRQTEIQYNEASAAFNEFNLQVTCQQSRINALVQEEEFKRNQLNNLRQQVETNASQLKQTTENI